MNSLKKNYIDCLKLDIFKVKSHCIKQRLQFKEPFSLFFIIIIYEPNGVGVTSARKFMPWLQTILPQGRKTPPLKHGRWIQELYIPYQRLISQVYLAENYSRIHELQRRHTLHGSWWRQRERRRSHFRTKINGLVQTHDQGNVGKSTASSWLGQVWISLCRIRSCPRRQR